MKPLTASSLLKYTAAFASGYFGALVPILATGDLPGRQALVAALAAGIVATGLLHCPNPNQPPGR